MKLTRNNLLSLLAIATTLVLSSCKITTNEIKSTAVLNKIKLTPGNGLVAVQVVNNTVWISPEHQRWSEINVVRVDNIEDKKQQARNERMAKKLPVVDSKLVWKPDIYTLTPIPNGILNTQVFIGQIPAGRYVVSQLWADHSVEHYSSTLNMSAYTAGEFEMKENHLTDLGAIIFQPLLNVKAPSYWNSHFWQRAYVTRLPNDVKTDNYVAGYFPQITKQTHGNPILGWNEDNHSVLREKLSTISKKNAHPIEFHPTSAGKRRAFGSKFGLLSVQNFNGKWTDYSLGTKDDVLSLLDEDKFIYVGFDKGKLIRITLEDESIKAYQPVSPKEAITWMDKSDSGFFIATQDGLNVYLYSALMLDGNWTKIKTFTVNKNTVRHTYGGLFPFVASNGQLRVINHDRLYQYNSETGWSIEKTNPLNGLVKLDNSTLAAIAGYDPKLVGFSTGEQLISIDNGQTWHPISRRISVTRDGPAFNSLPAKFDDDRYVTVGRFLRSESKSELRIMTAKFEDIGRRKKWQAHSKIKPGCSALIPEFTQDKTIFFLCDGGAIVSTSDLGTTWKTERDIDILLMQLEVDQLIIKHNKMLESSDDKDSSKKFGFSQSCFSGKIEKEDSLSYRVTCI